MFIPFPFTGNCNGENPAELEVVVIGNPSGNESLYYEPTVLDTIPLP